jgi:Mrp family chromosome partitioning ATPase/capsular polysaccharide biosynthesis protein
MNQTTDTSSIFAPLWRRKWLILAVGIVVAAASYFYYKHKTAVYQVTTQVYLGAGVEESAAGEKSGTKGQTAVISNQVAVINSIIIEKVRHRLHQQHKGAIARGKVKAKAEEKSEFISITAEGHTPKGVALLANATAQTYINRQQRVREAVIERSIAITRRQLRRIELSSLPKAPKATGGKTSTTTTPTTPAPSTANVLQEANLQSKINQLEASLGQGGAQQIKPAKATNARQVSPKPRQNAIFGFVIGLALAAIAAYAFARVDRRVRSLPAVESLFHTEILTGLPKVRRPIVSRDGQVMPSRFLLEPLRRLHVALQLAAPPGGARGNSRVILFTSADPGDGKSTVVADLALVQRDAGARVAVVEANLRRPVQARLLGLDSTRGLADVLEGGLPLADAMQRVLPLIGEIDPVAPVPGAGPATAVAAPPAGSLFLLGGGAVPNPPALLANGGISDVLDTLAVDFDYVLIDAPSPLQVSDAMALFGLVDGIVIVARLGYTREASAQRLAQLLAHSSRAPVIGAAANCVTRGEAERYGISMAQGRAGPARLIGR